MVSRALFRWPRLQGLRDGKLLRGSSTGVRGFLLLAGQVAILDLGAGGGEEPGPVCSVAVFAELT